MRTHWAGLGTALLWTFFSACDCGSTTPGGNGDGGGNGVVDANGVVDGSGGFDLVGRDLVGIDVPGRDSATAADRPGWQPNDGSIQLEDGGVIITEDGGNQWQCIPVSCYGQGPLECGDCANNTDNDGLIDWRDPDCLGPCDNTEGPGLESGVGGTTGSSCGVDCYFDFGNGAGNDQCLWDHRCDVLSPEAPASGCDYDPDFVANHGDRACPAVQPEVCSNFCKPITPNGCDCFGCCTFPALATAGPGGSVGYVWIGNMDDDNVSTCTLEKLTDTIACPPCTPVGNCLNECGHCELCVGKPTLPEDCYQPDAGPLPDRWIPQIDAGSRDVVGVDLVAPRDAARPDTAGTDAWRPDAARPDAWVPPRCDTNVVPCGLPGDPECVAPFYCVTGCCVYFGG